jgi:hypothetical protein
MDKYEKELSEEIAMDNGIQYDNSTVEDELWDEYCRAFE